MRFQKFVQFNLHRFILVNLIAITIGLLQCQPAVAEKVMIPMRDGVKLAADYYLPAGEGPFPVVLSRSVYGRNPVFAPIFTGMGMVYIVQDTRGRGDSEGKDTMFADDGWGDLQDGADTVAWILEQPWCNGKIGTFGPSALSIVQVLMAPATPRLTCQVIWVASCDFYGQLSYQGGVWRKALCEDWLNQVKSPHIIELWKSHPTKDDFWKKFEASAQASRVHAPALHVGGWWDIFQQGTIDNFVTRQNQGGEGAKGNQQLILGPWLHGPVKKPGDLTMPDNFQYDFTDHSKRFFEYWLAGKDNGVMNEPPVRYYTLGDVKDPSAPGNEWRTATTWPPFPTVATPYYLKADGSLDTAKPTDEKSSLTFKYDPANPCPTKGGAELTIPAGPFDQRAIGERADVLKFATPVLEQPVEVTGRVKVKLYVSSDAPDTDFTAKLIDIYPDGSEILMLDGIQRVKYRNGFEKAEPLPIGEIGEIEIDLWSISLIFNKGHRIGLHISSSNYPRFEVNPNTGDDFPPKEGEMRVAQNTVHLNSLRPSALILPIPEKDAEHAAAEK
ncbi:MAG TPA: CocE/NonD family hydrolase [Candidatus Hydrogenedentes bacterium]|mgnify:CR=1 FL=1|nr:CocE/NonD family hydrolase [Candidatus Hydrogenedentota bacterium]HOL76178.1 CocE/NonD family hydrolase [Candidatus Hydrogenedentota bacterium]HPO84793.1 CocE/NonD family hydrolase [Candidatus Hydrogenedentota bacterium]